MYIPAMRCKYSTNVMVLTDSGTSYLYNAFIYCGKDSDDFDLSDEEKKYSKPTQAVLRLAKSTSFTKQNKAC